jgi:hypothetical protein
MGKAGQLAIAVAIFSFMSGSKASAGNRPASVDRCAVALFDESENQVFASVGHLIQLGFHSHEINDFLESQARWPNSFVDFLYHLVIYGSARDRLFIHDIISASHKYDDPHVINVFGLTGRQYFSFSHLHVLPKAEDQRR